MSDGDSDLKSSVWIGSERVVAASRADREREDALRRWCAEANLDPDDRAAPHVQAFIAGYDEGREDEYHAYLRSSVT